MIFISYGVLVSRFIDAETIFTDLNGNMTSAVLPRRDKGELSTVHWADMGKKLEDNFLQRQKHGEAKCEAEHSNEKSDADADDDADADADLPSTPAFKRKRRMTTGQTDGTSPTSRAAVLDFLVDFHKKVLKKHQQAPEQNLNEQFDVYVQEGDEADNREVINESVTGQRMLKLFFRHKGLDINSELIDWCKANEKELPAACRCVWRLSPKFFDINGLKSGDGLQIRIVCYDEAHALRNINTTHHYAALLLPAQSLLGLSGTSMFNNTEDVKGYSSLFAARSGLDDDFNFVGKDPDILTSGIVRKSKDVVKQGFVTEKKVRIFFFSVKKGQDLLTWI